MNYDVEKIARDAKEASFKIQNISSEIKNNALLAIAESLIQNKDMIFDANRKDLLIAKELLNNKTLSSSSYKRLKLSEDKMDSMIAGVKDLIKITDPINRCLLARELDKDLNLYQISCPIGVLGVIFEARPDVITQISALAIKSSNVVILKGGKEAKNTNMAIFSVINSALNKIKEYPKNVINQVFLHED